MKQVNTLLIMICLCYSIHAQQNSETQKNRDAKVIVKWSPLHLIDHFPTFQIAVEQKIIKNISLQYDFGPVLSMTGFFSDFDTNKRGYKSKIQVRRYFSFPTQRWRVYVAPEIGYNYIDFTRGKTYLVEGIDDLSYYQYIESQTKYRETNLGLIGGARYTTYRFCIDFQIGVVGRFMKFTAPMIPGTHYHLESPDNNIRFEYYSDKSRNEIRPSVAVRFGYIIR